MDDRRHLKLEDKLDKISDHISDINITLAKQSVILEEHVKRTNLLEEKIKPIERHVVMANGALKLIAALSMIACMAEAVKAMMK